MPTPDYPIDREVFTTLDRTIMPTPVPATSPKIFPYEVTKYAQYGYGAWTYGSGLVSEKRFDLMAPNYASGAMTNAANLLSFFTISDIHLTDEESPVQAINAGYKGGSIAAYSPSIRYTTQAFEAAVQTINALHKKSPFDFGLSLGDATNNTQYNELRWYIDILDGKKINPDSGAKNDPITGPLNDYQDEYQAQGLDPTIPWYQTIGNHDILAMGTYPVDDETRATFTGTGILNQ